MIACLPAFSAPQRIIYELPDRRALLEFSIVRASEFGNSHPHGTLVACWSKDKLTVGGSRTFDAIKSVGT